ncbi:uncharacterized protein [Oryza sativa Japonica Group]|uniref:uncharacterized protein n=1 Tax=Oryza sativa subsp. japonica TaxID=39947 RepID=UPI00339CA365
MARDEAAGASLGPTPSGDAQDQTGPGDIPEAGTSIGGPSRAASSPRQLFPMPSVAPLSAEPLLQALAAANTAVLDGLSAQVEALQAERAELDAAWARVEEGRHSVEAMVEAGRKAHRRHVSDLEARKTALAEIAREVEEERGAALIATTRACVAEKDLADHEAAVASREATLVAHESACAEEESALRLREDALAERERALEEAEAEAQRLADSLSLREAALTEQARRNLESVRAERAALEQRAADLEAREKELDARDPNFSPWMALDEFPPGTEDSARAQVRDAADHIVHSFEGSAPQLAFAPNSDEEGDASGADDVEDEAGDPGASE